MLVAVAEEEIVTQQVDKVEAHLFQQIEVEVVQEVIQEVVEIQE